MLMKSVARVADAGEVGGKIDGCRQSRRRDWWLSSAKLVDEELEGRSEIEQEEEKFFLPLGRLPFTRIVPPQYCS